MNLLRSSGVLLLAAGHLAGTAYCEGAGTAIMSAHKRLEVIKTAEVVLSQRQPTWKVKVAELPDPFFRKNVAEIAKEESKEAAGTIGSGRTDEEILDNVAPKIRPTGTMLIGDEQYLLLAGKRFRVGDQISVTFEGMVYRLSFSSIERNSYTLRLNDYELERDFK